MQSVDDAVCESGRVVVDIRRDHNRCGQDGDEEVRGEEHRIQLAVGRLVPAEPAHGRPFPRGRVLSLDPIHAVPICRIASSPAARGALFHTPTHVRGRVRVTVGHFGLSVSPVNFRT